MNFICQNQAEAGADRVKTVCLDWFAVPFHQRIDLLKLDIQGTNIRPEGCAEVFNQGRPYRNDFMELNWAEKPHTLSASASIHFLEQAGYRFSRPGRSLKWEKDGDWLRGLSDVVARKA
jgi:hypothetical protein